MPAHGPDWPYSQPPWVNRDGAFAAPTAAEVDAFEQRHAVKLPPDYRQFLLTFAGGPPEGCSFRVPGLEENRRLAELYPLTTDSEGASLEGTVDWDEFFPREMLAFADDGCGNWFCIGIRGQISGRVFYVDHDYERDHPLHISQIAASFQQFMQSSQPPDPPSA